MQGAITSATSLANIFGPLIGSQIFAWSISKAVQPAMPGLVFFSCAAMGVAGGLVALYALKQSRIAA